MYSRGGRKASATGVKVAGIGTTYIKAKELDSPLALKCKVEDADARIAKSTTPYITY